jgi:putative flavoprotein involved in K+ transport
VVDTVVIGAGQAGLATSFHLRHLGIEHMVVERGRVAETWRTARWDGFHLNTPNWATRLPGAGSPDVDPDAFAPLAEVIKQLARYAESIAAPLTTGVEVLALRRAGDVYELDTTRDRIRASSVVVATGAFQRPTVTPLSEQVPRDVTQLHSVDYRRPGDLPSGGVLIIGSGQSGCEIAQELIDAGRNVHLSVGRCPWAPRRYRGRELIRWMIDIGAMDDTAAVLASPEARVAGNVTVSGARGGCDCHPLLLEAAGTHLHGRLTGFVDGCAVFADDLAVNLEKGLEFEHTLRHRCDEYALAAGLDLPVDPPVKWHPQTRDTRPRLPLKEEGTTTVLWANGFRPSFGWIQLPVLDDMGWPIHTRGISQLPGLAFVGLPWLNTRKSPLLLGVGQDAQYVAQMLAAHLQNRSTHAAGQP